MTERADIRKQLDYLRRADMAELTTSPNFTATVDGEERSFGELIRRTLRSKLAVELVQAGYIDRNFTMYVSQYHGVSAKLIMPTQGGVPRKLRDVGPALRRRLLNRRTREHMIGASSHQPNDHSFGGPCVDCAPALARTTWTYDPEPGAHREWRRHDGVRQSALDMPTTVRLLRSGYGV